MKIIVKIILLFIFAQCIALKGQSEVFSDNTYIKSGARLLKFAESKERAIKFAKQDIENGTPYIFLQSGIAPIVFSTDSIFEKKYIIKYNEEGCSGTDKELAKVYNHEIYDYLLFKYGKDWIFEIRQDAIGLKAWRSKNNM